MDRMWIYFVALLLYTCSIGSAYGYKSECTQAERSRVNCLNDGDCVAIELETREPVCHCPRRFTGSRCQDLNFDFYFSPSTMPVNRSWLYVMIFGCIVGGFILGSVVTIVVSKWCRRRRRRQRAETESRNGHVSYKAVSGNVTEMATNSV